MEKDYRKMTLTIFQLTALYVACNISFSIYYCIEWDVLLASKNIAGSQAAKDAILDESYGVCILIPIIGAAVEPIILLNGSNIRRYVKVRIAYCFYTMTCRAEAARHVVRKYEVTQLPRNLTYSRQITQNNLSASYLTQSGSYVAQMEDSIRAARSRLPAVGTVLETDA